MAILVLDHTRVIRLFEKKVSSFTLIPMNSLSIQFFRFISRKMEDPQLSSVAMTKKHLTILMTSVFWRPSINNLGRLKPRISVLMASYSKVNLRLILTFWLILSCRWYTCLVITMMYSNKRYRNSSMAKVIALNQTNHACLIRLATKFKSKKLIWIGHSSILLRKNKFLCIKMHC